MLREIPRSALYLQLDRAAGEKALEKESLITGQIELSAEQENGLIIKIRQYGLTKLQILTVGCV
jgi:uncharacterized protein YjfI (DUF2170 family)